MPKITARKIMRLDCNSGLRYVAYNRAYNTPQTAIKDMETDWAIIVTIR